jgi:N-acetylmuramoyl-L-alanine amidase
MRRKFISQITNISRNFTPVYLMILLISLILHSFSAKGAYKTSTGLSTIIIDAGHGGKDPGAVVGRAKEKDIVLDIALRLGKLIKQSLPDVKVIYTRQADYFIPLFERAVIANNNNANLFISIHANFCRTQSVKGTETYVLGLHRTQDNLDVAKKENSVILLEDDYTTHYEGFDPNSTESYILFELIQDNYIKQSITFAEMVQDVFRQEAQRADRDVRQAGFLVLRETAMPSVLIETGYLSNKSEAAYLMTQNGRETIATSIFRSIKNYKSRIESRLNLNSGEKKPMPQEITENEDNKKDIPKILKGKQGANDSKIVSQKIQSQINKELVKPNRQSSSEKTRTNEIVFAIQIAASKVKLPLTSKLFKGIGNIREIQVGDYFKYFCMESDSHVKIKQNFLLIQKKIPDAFIVGLKNGQVISYTETINHK